MAFPSSLLKDICGILALAAVSIGLGIFARTSQNIVQPSAGGTIAVSELPHPSLSLAEFRSIVETRSAPLLDARNPRDYSAGHVPGALNLPAANFDTAYAKLDPSLREDKERLLVVYCSDMWCGLADELQQKFINRGHRHVARFADGWKAWRDAGLPEEKSP